MRVAVLKLTMLVCLSLSVTPTNAVPSGYITWLPRYGYLDRSMLASTRKCITNLVSRLVGTRCGTKP